MKRIRQAAIQAGKALGLSGVALLAYVNQAMAAVPTDITTALTTAATDGATVATAVVALGFSIWGIKYLLKTK